MRSVFLSLSVLMLLALAGGNSLVDAQITGGRPASEVLVVNDKSRPVPTEAIGTTAVSGSVTIANDAAAPVPVRNVDVPAAPTPFVVDADLFINPGEEFETQHVFSAPFGKRLVVEAFTVEANAPTGQVVYAVTILGSEAGVGARFHFPLDPALKIHPNFDRFVTVQQTRINVSSALLVTGIRIGDTGTALVQVAISGFLVDR
jgi:hypothetical protein